MSAHAACVCGDCLLTKARRARELLELRKAEGDNPFAFNLDEADAETAGTLTAVYMHEIGAAQVAEAHGLQRTAAQAQAGLDRADYYRTEGMALLRESARTRLKPIIGDLHDGLRSMVEGNINPLAAAQAFQRQLALVESAGGVAGVQGQYAPFEWARLCRTEAAFAYSAAEGKALDDEYEPDWTAVDAAGGRVPVHPNCVCGQDVVEVNGKWYGILDPAPSACELCQDIADEILAAIGA